MITLKGKVPQTTHSYTKHSQKKKVGKERQRKKAKYTSIKQRKAKACTQLSDNLYSVLSAKEAHKLMEDFETRNTVKFSCYKD